jgi:HEAT repeat protein
MAAGLLAVLVLAGACRAGEDLVAGKTSGEWLKMLAGDKEARRRQAAVIALEQFGPKVRGVVPGLTEALRADPSPDVRRAIAQALGRMGEDAKVAIPDLATALRADKSERVREAAARALGGSMVPYSRTAVPALAEALTDAQPAVRAAAAEALKDLGPEARPALRQLLDVLKDGRTDRFTRLYVLQALSRFPNEAASVVPALLASFRDLSAPPQVRAAAADALGRLGAAASPAAPELARTLQDKAAPAALRRACAEALARLGPDPKLTWPAAKVALADPDASVRTQAIRLAGVLGKGEPAVVGALIVRCDDDNVEARLAAIQELGQLGPAARAAEPVLRGLARNDSRPSVREAAATALKKVTASP